MHPVKESRRSLLRFADFVDPMLQPYAIERGDRKARKELDARIEDLKSVSEGDPLIRFRPLEHGHCI